jgi:DNA topoisomerase-1
MAASEPMAVVAPNLESTPSNIASHAPDVKPAPRAAPVANGNGDDSEEDMPLARQAPKVANGSAPKREVESSSEDERPLSKKPRVSAGAVKKRRILDSDDESEEERKGAGPSSSPDLKVKKEAPPTVS